MAFQEPALTASYGLRKAPDEGGDDGRMDIRKVELGHLVKDREEKLVWAKSSATAAEVMELLRSTDRVVLPIWDEPLNEFIGVVHIFEVVMGLLAASGAEGNGEELMKLAGELAESCAIGDLLLKKRKESEACTAGERCLECFNCADPIAKSISALCEMPHRILLKMTEESARDVSGKKEVVQQAGGVVEGRYRLLSQTDVIRYIVNHESELGRQVVEDFLLASVEELGLVQDRPVYCFQAEGKRALDAFVEMKKRKSSALGICEKGTGRLLYNLSASDLKGMTVERLGLLLKPLSTLLNELEGRQLIFPVTVQPRTSVKDLIEVLLAAKAHRAYVIDEQQKPIAVISFSDVLQKIVC